MKRELWLDCTVFVPVCLANCLADHSRHEMPSVIDVLSASINTLNTLNTLHRATGAARCNGKGLFHYQFLRGTANLFG